MSGFREAWYPPRDLDALRVAARLAPAAGVVVEFGSWEGRSALVLCEVLHPRLVVCVDPWDGSGGEQYARSADAYKAFMQNTRWASVIVQRMTWQRWVAAAREWTVSIALAHIDAEHTYPETRDLIRALLPLVEPGGVICGHDYDPRPAMEGGWPGVVRAVDEALPSAATVQGTVWWWVNQ